MKLRTARKIVKAVADDSPRKAAYNGRQVNAALDRVGRTGSNKGAQQFWDQLMDDLGVLGRAKVLADCGAPAMALGLLMRTPEAEWTYGTPSAGVPCSK